MQHAILLGCLLPSIYSAYTDAANRDLYDFITIPVFLLGLTYAVYTGAWGNIATAGVVFILMFFMALNGGMAGGDAKFTTAIAVWFGCPSILYIMALASFAGTVYGAGKLHKMGILKERMVNFSRGIYLRVLCGVRGAIPQNRLPENDQILEEAIPFGSFLVAAAWLVYFF